MKTICVQKGRLGSVSYTHLIGYAELPGTEPEKYLAAICHVDVVPAGNGWSADPFQMRLQEDWMLGFCQPQQLAEGLHTKTAQQTAGLDLSLIHIWSTKSAGR